MDTPNPPHAIHGKAIDLASEGDRIWFEQNPDLGTTWRDIVTQIKELDLDFWRHCQRT
jgi:hypothetical protein